MNGGVPFTFWGLVAVLVVILLGYVIWMFLVEADEDA